MIGSLFRGVCGLVGAGVVGGYGVANVITYRSYKKIGGGRAVSFDPLFRYHSQLKEYMILSKMKEFYHEDHVYLGGILEEDINLACKIDESGWIYILNYQDYHLSFGESRKSI